MSTNLKSAIQFIVITLTGGIFMYFVFKDTNWTDLIIRMQSANLTWLFFAMVVCVISHWIRAYRATLLYDAMGYHVGTINSFYAVLIGYMMNYIIPRAGEVSRCASLAKTDKMPLEKSLGTVVTERIVDMVLLLMILGFIFLLQFDMFIGFITKSINERGASTNEGSILKWILLIVFGSIVLLIFVLRKRLKNSPLFVKFFSLIQGFADGLLSIRHIKKPMLFILLSILIWVCYIFMMYLCLFAMEATSHLSFVDCLTVFAIGTLGVVLPAPGAGAGTYHFFVMQSLLLFGVAKEDGIAYATMVHGAQMILLLALGAVASLLVLVQQKRTKTNEQIQ
ncbi:MAG: flippase-like domain-containing protein [Bacteroidia bacterium]|nr:flippase-like domain-containing protein [Bacteroidia bacterium]